MGIDYDWYDIIPNRGINQSAEKADPRIECLDALNVWAPEGLVIGRPGIVGVNHVGAVFWTVGGANNTVAVSTQISTSTFVVVESGGVFTETDVLNNLAVGARWYLGFSSWNNTTNPGQVAFIDLGVVNFNVNATNAKVEYWNGTEWQWLQHIEVNTNTNTALTPLYHLQNGGNANLITLVAPRDWATTTLTGITGARYYLRFMILDAALDASSEVNSGAFTGFTDGYGYTVLGGFTYRLPTRSKAVFLTNAAGDGVLAARSPAWLIASSTALIDAGTFSEVASSTIVNAAPPQGALLELRHPMSHAVVPYAGETYVSFNSNIRRFLETYAGTYTDTVQEPRVEDRDFATGPGAPYDKNTVAQLASFPKASFISFFQDRFWLAGLEDDPHAIRWGAPGLFYRVLPALSFERIIEADDTRLTAIAPFRESMHVYKSNSIYQMAFTQIDSFGLARYVPRLVVRGRGCIAPLSIQDVNDIQVFLAEDGLYAFNGVTVKHLSEREGTDRLGPFWASLTPSRRPFAAGYHWREKRCYLLACAVNGSATNNRVLCWDYQTDAFWIWDGLEVLNWMPEGNLHEPTLLNYLDYNGRIYRLSEGHGTDHGAVITHRVETHRIGYPYRQKLNARVVEVEGSNEMDAATFEVIQDGRSSGKSASVDFDDNAESKYGTGVYGTATYSSKRTRLRKLGFWAVGNNLKAKITHTAKGRPFSLSKISVGILPMGRR